MVKSGVMSRALILQAERLWYFPATEWKAIRNGDMITMYVLHYIDNSFLNKINFLFLRIIYYLWFNFIKAHQILHAISNKCIEMSKDGSKLLMNNCDPNNKFQNWTFKEYNETKAREHGLIKWLSVFN